MYYLDLSQTTSTSEMHIRRGLIIGACIAITVEFAVLGTALVLDHFL